MVRGRKSERERERGREGYEAHLCMDESIVEEHEPVHREPSGILQCECLVAALTHQPPRRFSQGILGQRRPVRCLCTFQLYT